jgi:hypothetical protein
MTIRLGGITLNDDLSWPDEFATPAAAGSSYQTCGPGGKTVFQRYSTSVSRLITLVAQEVDGGLLGYFSYAQCQAIKALEGGAPVELEYEGRIFTVLVMSCAFVARLPRPNHQATDLFTGSVTMREV